MTLEEAIQHCEEVMIDCSLEGNTECSVMHRQLMEWLIELKQYREMRLC